MCVLKGTSPVLLINSIIFLPVVVHYMHQCGQLLDYISSIILWINAFVSWFHIFGSPREELIVSILYCYVIDSWGSMLYFQKTLLRKGIYTHICFWNYLIKWEDIHYGNFTKLTLVNKNKSMHIYYKYLLWPMILTFLISAFYPKVASMYKHIFILLKFSLVFFMYGANTVSVISVHGYIF